MMSSSSSGSESNNNNNNNNAAAADTAATASAASAEFAFQEMRALLNAMESSKVVASNMKPEQRIELAEYVEQVCDNKVSPVNVRYELDQHLPGTKWKLAFSTDPAALDDLPRDATVYLNFRENDNPLGVKFADYVLQFSKKTLGLDRIKAESTWDFNNKVGDPQSGLLTMVYDRITTDVMGFQNVGVGLFGLLRGRANYMYSAYYDGDYWIEKGIIPSSSTTNTEAQQPNFFYNVYVKANDDEIAL